MADIHVITIANGRAQMVCHIPIPAGTNAAGVSWQAALVNSGIGGTTVLLDGDGSDGTIGAAEKASIQAGALFEVVTDELIPDSVSTGPTRLTYIDAVYNAIVAREQARLQSQLKYFGFTRDVP